MFNRISPMIVCLIASAVGIAYSENSFAEDADWADCSSAQFDRVLRGCNAVLARKPEGSKKHQAIAYYNIGVAHHEKGAFAEAIANYNEAVAREASNSEYFYARGTALWAQAKKNDALADLGRALQLSKNSAKAYSARGNILRALGELEKAAADYSKAVALEPKMYLAHYGLGKIYSQKNQRNEAVREFTRVIEIKPDFAAAYTDRGRVEADLKHFSEALADFTKAVELSPTAEAYAQRALVTVVGGDPTRALADYDKAVELSPTNAALRVNRGLAYMRAGKPDDALADFRKAAEIEPRQVLAHQFSSYLLLLRGDNDGAVADATRAIDDGAAGVLPRQVRAHASANKGDYDAAIHDFTSAIAIAPSAMDYAARGAANLKLKNFAAAKADFGEAIKREPNNASNYLYRGRAARAMGDIAAAQNDFSAALKINPAFADAKNSLASVTAVAEPAVQPQKITTPVISTGRLNRVALVVGNSNYKNVSRLKNPGRDTQAVADQLKRIGFREVIRIEDADRAGMIAALRDFEDKVANAEWALVYYAGHGMEINGSNYLIPIDASLKQDRDVQDEAVPMSRVISAMERAKAMKLLIMDACRDNPFLAKMSTQVATRSVSRGLARIDDAEGGVLIVYSAKHGQVAMDGFGQNSPFVSALLKQMDKPGLEIRKLFGLVRDDVLGVTGRKQEPYIYGALGGDDYVLNPP